MIIQNYKKEKTIFFEILFRSLLIGVTMYDKQGKEILIEELIFDPIVKKIYILSDGNTYKLNIDDNYEFKMDNRLSKLIKPKSKFKGKRNII